ncbi:MAG: hypothetical protein R3D00_14845 [Bacteroidia bacterium]
MKTFYSSILLLLLFIISCNPLQEELILPDGELKSSEMFIPGADAETGDMNTQADRSFPCRMRGVMFPAPPDWECRVLIELETGHLINPVNIEDYFSGEVENPVLVKVSFIQLQNSPNRCGRAIPVQLTCLTRDSRTQATIPGREN